MQLAELPIPGLPGPMSGHIMPADGEKPGLNMSQKAAVIVQMMLTTGGKLSLSSLSKDGQTRLAHDFTTVGHVSQDVLNGVIAEFEACLARDGLRFPDGIAGALNTLDGTLNPRLVMELRQRLGIETSEDPWPKLAAADVDDLAAALSGESPRIGAVILSKMKPGGAATVMDALSPEDANAITFAMSEVTAVSPENADRIGRTIVATITRDGELAFQDTPVDRAAAILNATSAAQRDGVLDGLVGLDEDFAAKVRKAIFTFADIPSRIDATDIPKVARTVLAEDMVTALVFATTEMGEAVEFILENMSKRMADQLRDDISDSDPVKAKAGEAAMSRVTTAIRDLIDSGEITLSGDEEGE